MSIKLLHVTAEGLGPYAEGLRALERDILYPIDDGADRFRIDHGQHYHPFFSAMGATHFLVALDGDEVVGTLAAVHRRVRLGLETIPAVYMCDYKIAPRHRGGALARKIWKKCLTRLAVDRRLRGWSLAYGAAMRGDKGDVSRSLAGKTHPGRLFRPAARLLLYFEPPETLAALDATHAPPPPAWDQGLDLSPKPDGSRGWVTTAGRKDLRLESTGAPWPLAHLGLGPHHWRPTWGHHLAHCGAAIAESGHTGPACFTLDERLDDHRRWLEGQGVTPGAVCTIHILTLPWRLRPARWIHLSPSEI